MASRPEFRALLNWQLLNGYYHQAYKECVLLQKRRGDDGATMFWVAVLDGMRGRLAEAVSRLTELKAKRDTELAAHIALVFFHMRQHDVDQDEVEVLNSVIPSKEDAASDNARILAAHFCLMSEDFSRGTRLIQRIVGGSRSGGVTAMQAQALSIYALSEMAASKGNPSVITEALRHLEDPSMDRDVDVVMTRACLLSMVKRDEQALDQLNLAIAMFSDFAPALIEKAKVMVSKGDWDQAMDAIQRVLFNDPTNIQANRVATLEKAVRHSNSEELANELRKKVLAGIDDKEPSNANEYYITSQLFSRFAGSNSLILDVTTSMLRRAIDILPMNPHYHTELGVQYRQQDQLDKAMEEFREAASLDEGNMQALFGNIHCQLLSGSIEDAEQQLEFLKAVQDGENAFVYFLDAMIVWRKEGDRERHARLLLKALTTHMNQAKRAQLGSSDVFTTLINYNVTFLLEIAEEFLVHRPSSGVTGGNGPSRMPVPLRHGLDVLQQITEVAPGFFPAHLLTARVYFSLKDFDEARHRLDHCLELQPSNSASHILRAQIALAQGHPPLADQSLEQALAYDFTVRSSPVYLLVKAQVLHRRGLLEDALREVETAFRVPGVQAGTNKDVSLPERAALFLEMASVLGELNRMSEAKKIITEARREFKGTGVEVDAIVTESRLALQRDDFDGAIGILNRVSQDSPAYMHAQSAKADIYLKYRHDKRAYARCYQDVVELYHDPQSYINLGEAYMRIQAPEAAVEAFERALEQQKGDTLLAGRVGKALVATHDYNRAVEYYTRALASAPGNKDLRLDLVRLLVKLRKTNHALQTLEPLLEQEENESFEDSTARIKALVFAADIQELLGSDEALGRLKAAHEAAHRVKKRMRPNVQSPEAAEALREELANICARLGKICEEHKDEQRAIEYYLEAIRVQGSNMKSLMALSKLYMKRDDKASCRKHCESILRVDAEHEGALVLLADLLFLENEFELASEKYRDLLRNKPNNYTALRKLILLKKRLGQLEDIPHFLKAAERANPRAFSHPGLNYCKGIYYKSLNELDKAIGHFNFARRDGEWGYEALSNMIELYLNPDNESIWDGKAFEEAVRTANKLTDELKEFNLSASGEKRLRILQGYAMLAQYQLNKRRSSLEDKDQLDRAEQAFIEILERDRDYVPAMLGVSIVFMVASSENRAKNTLKRIAKMPYDAEYADEFERAYLYLADVYIQKDKVDFARDLCKRALQYNRSCGKAWEQVGITYEKEMSYKDAAEAYEMAWKFTNETSAQVGFRLGFNYLKAKKFVEAIDVCNKVLRNYPDYPKIREEILQKAIQSIRP